MFVDRGRTFPPFNPHELYDTVADHLLMSLAAHINQADYIVLDRLSVGGHLTMEELISGTIMSDDIYVEGSGQMIGFMWCFFSDTPLALQLLTSLLIHEALGQDYHRAGHKPLDRLREGIFQTLMKKEDELEQIAYLPPPMLETETGLIQPISYIRLVVFFNPELETVCYRFQWLTPDRWGSFLPGNFNIIRINIAPCLHERSHPMYCDLYLDFLEGNECYLYDANQIFQLIEQPYPFLISQDRLQDVLTAMSEPYNRDDFSMKFSSDTGQADRIMALIARYHADIQEGKDPDEYITELVDDSFNNYFRKIISWPPRLAQFPSVIMSIRNATNVAIITYSGLVKDD
jgi:hypothetical protein